VLEPLPCLKQNRGSWGRRRLPLAALRTPETQEFGLAAAWHEHLDRLDDYLNGHPVRAVGTIPPAIVDRYRDLINEQLT